MLLVQSVESSLASGEGRVAVVAHSAIARAMFGRHIGRRKLKNCGMLLGRLQPQGAGLGLGLGWQQVPPSQDGCSYGG